MAVDVGSALGTSVALFGRLFSVIVAYYVLKFGYQVIYYHFFHPLSKFPGPFWASATRLYITFWNLKETEHEHMLDLHRQYGMLSCRSCRSSC